ncbi:nucleotide disphospho-sugar-binding domain-containing protein [Micromonospora aurantiaca (nom. illeg.)]|uniref:nucleotide disphospho-sugar-binding domain-containing protein n=1 Tax=Micromonospora aurantiaca (nom. illeg.) TaxID=47850 RepID=UPI003EBE2ACD
MKVLFTVSSWPTHYAVMVPIGWALQAGGHEVRVLCTPSQVAPLCAAGLTPVPILDSPSDEIRLRLQYFTEAVDGVWPYPWPPLHPITGAQLDGLDDFDLTGFRERQLPEVAARAAASFDAAVEYTTAFRPDFVLHDPASLEGLLAGLVTGVKTAMVLWGPVGPAEPEHMRIVPDDISGSFARYGLGPFDAGMIKTVVDPCPSSVEPPLAAERLPVRYVPYNGTAPAPTWLLEPIDRPRVCLSWSTALRSMSGPRSFVLPEAVRALEGLDAEVVLTATAQDVAELGPVPPTVRVLERLPLRLLLPTCSAVVHHGGGGSTLTSLWAGVPQVLLTFASEQAASATRVAAAGAAVQLPGHLVDAAAIRRAIDELLADGSYRRSAVRLRGEMEQRPTPADLVDLIGV